MRNRISGRLFILMVMGLLASSWVHAQRMLEGVVVGQGRGEVLPKTEVFLQEKGAVVQTDDDGAFRFEGIADEVVTLMLYKHGYELLTYYISLDSVRSKVKIELRVLSNTLSEVYVREQRSRLFAMRRLADVEGTSIYASKKTEVVQVGQIVGNLAANNARQIYAQVAGLNIYDNSDAGIQLHIGGRGLDPNRTSNFNTRQNGYDISADVLGYPESYYTPSAEAVEEIQVVRGASSLQYGTQFGGLVNFVLKDPSERSLEVETRQTIGSFGQFTSFNRVSGTSKKLSYQAFYNYKTGEGYRSHADFDSHNVFGQLSYRLSARSSLKLEYTHLHYLAKQAGGLTDSQFGDDPRQATRERNYFRVNWNLFNASYRTSFGEQALLDVSLFGLSATRDALGFRGDPLDLNSNPITSLDERLPDGSYVQPRDLIRGKFGNVGAEARFLRSYSVGKVESKLLLGAKYYHAENSSEQGPGSRGGDSDFQFYSVEFSDYPNQSYFEFPNRNLAFFAENIFQLDQRWSFTPGMRLEHILTRSEGSYVQLNFDNAGNAISRRELEDNRSLTRTFVLLGLGISYKPNLSLEAYGNLSQNYRSVTFSDIRVVNPTFIVDPNIDDESGWTLDVGLRGSPRPWLNYDIGVYAVRYADRIGVVLDDRANRVRKNIGTARIVGFESYAELALLKLLREDWLNTKLNFFLNAAFTEAEYVTSEENNVAGNQVEFVPSWNIKSGVKAGWRNLFASLQYSFLSEQFTDAQNSTVPPSGDGREGIVGSIPAYDVLDLSLTYIFGRFSLDVGMNNLMNRDYFTRRAFGYPGPGIIPSDGRSVYFTLGAKI